MSKSIAVIGSGIAGAAAAFGASRAGKRVTLISSGVGASAMSSGAVDDLPWETLEAASKKLGADPPASAISPEVQAFVEALDLWTIPASRPMRLATVAGRIRMARGADHALLDLNLLDDGARILVPRACRGAWDADALADGLNADPCAKKRDFKFLAMDAALLRFSGEERISDVDLAARHDDEARVSWLAHSLQDALIQARQRLSHCDAILLGPWLGMRSAKAKALSEILGVPVGEALLGVGSPSGFRFEHARDRLLASLGVHRVGEQVRELVQEEKGVRLRCSGDAGEFTFDAAVLAVGGTAGGGFLYCPPDAHAGEDLPERLHLPFALSLRADLPLAFGQDAAEISSSMHGPEMDFATWPGLDRESLLSRVGIRAEGGRVSARLWTAGDCIAGRYRTVLQAISSGLEAGQNA